MESPVVLDKPPEYHGTDRGFPFGEEEGSDAWSELAARHPDIAARLRQRPASTTWARKRRPSSQDATDDFGENFGSFGDRFGFDDFPPEFREHLPSHWNRRFGSREEAPSQPPTAASPPSQPNQSHQSHQSHQPHQHTAATQTDAPPDEAAQTLPQYGLRNTVDLGQKSPADPSLVDAEERTHRSASAPPDAPPHEMSAPHPEPPPRTDSGNVRVIPILVEGRDEPVISKAQHSRPHAEPMSAFDRDQYFADDAGASFHHSPHFSRAFGAPNTKGFRQPPQPFQQKVFPQNAFPRGASPQRSQTPKPPAPAQEEHFVKVPVPQQQQQQQQQQHQQQQQQQQSAPPQREQTPPHVPPTPCSNDPKEQILRIQADVLNLMDQVENFTGSKMGKTYLYLDEMLTRNLIKLDNIETEGKEKIRQARKDAIKCIQNCIAVLEAKAEKNGFAGDRRPSDVDMKDVRSAESAAAEKGEVKQGEAQANSEEAQPQEKVVQEPAAATDPQHMPSEDKPEEQNKEDKPSPKNKDVKKCDESKDKAPANSAEAAKDSIKLEANVDVLQVDNKGDKTEQVMEVDGAASQ